MLSLFVLSSQPLFYKVFSFAQFANTTVHFKNHIQVESEWLQAKVQGIQKKDHLIWFI